MKDIIINLLASNAGRLVQYAVRAGTIGLTALLTKFAITPADGTVDMIMAGAGAALGLILDEVIHRVRKPKA